MALAKHGGAAAQLPCDEMQLPESVAWVLSARILEQVQPAPGEERHFAELLHVPFNIASLVQAHDELDADLAGSRGAACTARKCAAKLLRDLITILIMLPPQRWTTTSLTLAINRTFARASDTVPLARMLLSVNKMFGDARCRETFEQDYAE